MAFRFQRSRVAVGMLFAMPMLAPHTQPKPVMWESRQVWTIDGSEGGEPFADLRDYVVLKNDHLWALDFKDQTIRRYDANGKFLSLVGHKGAGPGEMSNANGMAVAPDGSVWVNDPNNARINIYGADGKYLRQVSRSAGGYAYRWDGWFNRANGELSERTIAGDQASWRRYDVQGKALSMIPYSGCNIASTAPDFIRAETPKQGATTMSYPFATGGGLASDGRGGVWCAAARSTRVALVRIGSNDTIAQTAVAIPNIAVGNEERAAAIERVEKMISRYSTNNFDRSKVASTKPGVAALHVDEDGRLWVQHAAKFNQPITTFDVFDGKGKHLAHMVLPVKQSTSMPVRARGNKMWLTVLDDDDVPNVVQYHISN